MDIHHRYFVQYMLKNGASLVNNALKYCRHVSKGKIDNITHFKTLVIEINREISKQFYKIVFSVCEVTNRNMVVWLNTKNDDISKLQISYSAIELEYFNAIFQEILNSEDYRITFIVCINITSTLTSHFSRDSGQKVLNKWINGGYYIKHGDYIHLGPRTILEFTGYLRSKCLNSICNLCSELVFTGRKCGHCGKTLHLYCLTTYLSNQNICPCCKNEWIHESEEQENVTTMDTDDDDNIMSSDVGNTIDTCTQSGTIISQVISSNRTSSSIYNQRNRYTEENYLSDIDEPGPSSRKRHR